MKGLVSSFIQRACVRTAFTSVGFDTIKAVQKRGKMRKKLLTILTVGVMSMVALTGCSSSANANETSTVGTVETTTAKETEKAAEETTANATDKVAEETITKDTEETKEFTDRVVASSVAVVEILDALDVPMVGVPTSSYDLPESVAEATRIGNPMSPDIEVIASLEPTVVVSVDSLSEDLATQFEVLGAESYFVSLSSYEGLKETITKLGERFGVEDKAAEIIAGFETKEQAIAEKVAGKEVPSVLIIFGAGASFMTASEDTYVGDLAKRVGAENIIVDAPSSFAPVDMEYLASKNPEYILFMSHANPEESLKAFEEEVAKNEAWQNFDAVKNNKLIALETGYFGMSANLLAPDAMEKLVEILYGEN